MEFSLPYMAHPTEYHHRFNHLDSTLDRACAEKVLDNFVSCSRVSPYPVWRHPDKAWYMLLALRNVLHLSLVGIINSFFFFSF